MPDSSVHICMSAPFVSQCVVHLQRLACHPVVYKRFSQQCFHLVLTRTLHNNNSYIEHEAFYFLKDPHNSFILKMRKLRHTVSNWQRPGRELESAA